MKNEEAIQQLGIQRTFANGSNAKVEAIDMAIKALEMQEKITKIVNGQLIAGKNNYKKIYECFWKLVKIVQDNY